MKKFKVNFSNAKSGNFLFCSVQFADDADAAKEQATKTVPGYNKHDYIIHVFEVEYL